MSFKTKKSLDVYGKASCLLLAVSVCAVISESESANASLKNGAKTTTSPIVKINPTYGMDIDGVGTGTRLQQSVLGDGSGSLPNQNLASSRLTGVNTTSIISTLGQGVGIDQSSGIAIGKISHKYGTNALNFQVIDVKGPLDLTKRYVQFVNIKGELKTYKEGFSTKAKLLWNYSEIGIDKYVGSDGKVHKYIYRSKPNWVSGADIAKAQSQKQSEQYSVYGEIYTGQNTGAIGSLGTPEEGIYSTKILYDVDGSDDRRTVRFANDTEQNKTYISTLNIDRNKEGIIGQSKSSGDGLKIHTSTLKINLGGKGTSQTGVNGDETKVHTGVLNIDPNKKGTSGSKDVKETTKFYAGFFDIDQSKKGTLGDQGREVPKTYTSTLTVKLNGKDSVTSQTSGKRKVNKISIINTQSKTGDKDKGSSQTRGKGDETKPYTGDLDGDSNKKGTTGEQTGQAGGQSQGEGEDPKTYTSTLNVNLGERDEGTGGTGGKKEVSKINISNSEKKTEDKDKGSSQTGGKEDETKPYTGYLDNDLNKKATLGDQTGQASGQDGDNGPRNSFFSELKHKLSQGGDNSSKPIKREVKVEKLSLKSEELNKVKEELKPIPSKGTSESMNEKSDLLKYIVKGKDTGWTTGARRGFVDIKKEVIIDNHKIDTMNTSGKVNVLSTYFEEKVKQEPKVVVSNLDGKIHLDVGVNDNRVKIEKTNVTLTDKEGLVKRLEIDPVFARNLSRVLEEGYALKVEQAKKNNPLTIDTKVQAPQPKPVDNTGEKVKALTSKVSEIKSSGDPEKIQKALDLLKRLRDKMNVQ